MKKRKIILKIILVLAIFFLLKTFWFSLTTKVYSYYDRLINSNNNHLPQNSLIFFRNDTLGNGDQDKTGVWLSNVGEKTETQLISYKNLYSKTYDKDSEKINSMSPTISPDKTKIAFYVGLYDKNSNSETPDGFKKHSLWIYDVVTKKTKLLLSDVGLLPGYARVPIWDSKSETVMIDARKGKYNRLFLVNLFGVKKEIATGAANDLFFPDYVGEHTVFFNNNKSGGRYIGSVNLKTGWTNIYDLGLDTIYGAGNTILKPDGFIIRAHSLDGKKVFENDEISGLVKYNYNTRTVEKFKINSNDIKLTDQNSFSVAGICSQWVILTSGGSESKDTFLYNLENSKLEKIKNSEGLVYYPECQLDKNRMVQVTYENVLEFDLSNPLPPKVRNYKNILDKTVGIFDKSGLYSNLFDVQDNLFFPEIEPGHGSYDIDTKKTGIYKINLDDQKIEQITHPDSDHIQDQFIFYYN